MSTKNTPALDALNYLASIREVWEIPDVDYTPEQLVILVRNAQTIGAAGRVLNQAIERADVELHEAFGTNYLTGQAQDLVDEWCPNDNELENAWTSALVDVIESKRAIEKLIPILDHISREELEGLLETRYTSVDLGPRK
jgi:hypothetical protein